MTILLGILIFVLAVYVFAPILRRWLFARAVNHINNLFGQESQAGKSRATNKKRKQAEGSGVKEKLDLNEIEKKRFDKGEGEYIDFEDVK